MQLPLNLENASYITLHLREQWLREIKATRGHHPCHLESFALDCSKRPFPAVCIGIDNVPIMMGGFVIRDHIAHSWLAGTDRTPEVAIEFQRHALRIIRDLKLASIKRLQSYVLDGPDENFHWLLFLGFNHEGTHPRVGHSGETFRTYGRLL